MSFGEEGRVARAKGSVLAGMTIASLVVAVFLSGCTAPQAPKAEPLKKPGTLSWIYKTEELEINVGHMLSSQGSLFFAPVNGIVSLDSSSGNLNWKRSYNVHSHSLAADARSLYFGAFADGSGSKLLALDRATGTERWSVRARNMIEDVMVVAGLVVVSTEHRVFAVRPSDGTIVWNFDADHHPNQGVNVKIGADEETVYVAGCYKHLYALDSKTGIERWRYEPPVKPCSRPVVSGDRIFGFAYEGQGPGTVFALDKETGKQVWSTTLEGLPKTIAATGAAVIFSYDYEEHIVRPLTALDRESGKELWTLYQGKKLLLDPVAFESTVYSTDNDGRLLAIDGRTGNMLWEYAGGPGTFAAGARPSVDSQHVYFVGGDGAVVAVAPQR